MRIETNGVSTVGFYIESMAEKSVLLLLSKTNISPCGLVHLLPTLFKGNFFPPVLEPLFIRL